MLKRLSAFCLFWGIGICNISAQNDIYIKEKDGTQTTFSMADFKSITFSAGNLNVNTNYSVSTYALSNVRYVSFQDFSPVITGIKAPVLEDNSFKVYPNPAKDVLYVQLAKTEPSELIIFDINGLAVVKSVIQNGVINVPLNTLNSGTYYCRVIQSDQVYTNLFIKE